MTDSQAGDGIRELIEQLYPMDDTPPFGDESLRDDPVYEIAHIVDRADAVEITERIVRLTIEATAESFLHKAFELSPIVLAEIAARVKELIGERQP